MHVIMKISSTVIQSMYHIFDVTRIYTGECE